MLLGQECEFEKYDPFGEYFFFELFSLTENEATEVFDKLHALNCNVVYYGYNEWLQKTRLGTGIWRF